MLTCWDLLPPGHAGDICLAAVIGDLPAPVYCHSPNTLTIHRVSERSWGHLLVWQERCERDTERGRFKKLHKTELCR